MGKKAKDPANLRPDSLSVSDSSNLFSKLFGQAPDPGADAPSSLFSADNPFRRKPGDDASQIPKEEEVTKGEKKKKKRNKEEIEGLDGSDGGKKSKREGKKGSKVDGESNPNAGVGVVDRIPDSAADSPMATGDGEEKTTKKKRKRDELEKDYEEKKYGAVADNGESKEKVVGKKRKSVENPAGMVVSKEGYDDETKLLRTIFVGNLPLKVKKKALLKEFSQFGEIESVRLRSVPTLDGKKPKKVRILNNKINEAVDSVHAYIVFKTEESVEASLAHNMAVVGGNHIRVDRACPPRKKLKGDNMPLYDTKRTIFVGNLPFDVKDEELYQLFCGINQVGSSIEAIRVIRDSHTSLGKGIAYVMLKTREAANIIAKRRNLKLRERELRISHAKPDSTSGKRKNPTYDGSETTPSKKRALEPTTPERRNQKTPAPYEGIRASKSGSKSDAKSSTEKKGSYRKGERAVAVRSATKSRTKEDVKQRSGKRPSVAARKAKVNAVRSQAGGGTKRKMGSRTPKSSSTHKPKKMKKA